MSMSTREEKRKLMNVSNKYANKKSAVIVKRLKKSHIQCSNFAVITTSLCSWGQTQRRSNTLTEWCMPAVHARTHSFLFLCLYLLFQPVVLCLLIHFCSVHVHIRIFAAVSHKPNSWRCLQNVFPCCPVPAWTMMQQVENTDFHQKERRVRVSLILDSCSLRHWRTFPLISV